MLKGFLTLDELKKIGFKSLGKNVFISDKACFYKPDSISIGSNVRIDDFCVLIGNISVGDYVHIATYSSIHASHGSVTIGNYSTLSSRVAIYSASDDYSGEYMTSPLISTRYTNVVYSDIVIGNNVIVGTGSTILPNSVLPDGTAIGAMSLVKEQLEGWAIYAGIPVRKLLSRSKGLLLLESEFEKSNGRAGINTL